MPRHSDASLLRRFAAGVAFVLCASRATAQVRLSQIYGGGGNTGATYESDFVELFNPGAPQSLAGWSIQYASASGSTWQVTPLPSVVLGTGQRFLVRQGTGSTVVAPQALALPSADASGAIAMSSTDGKVALCDSASPLGGATPVSAQIVDFVGYGTLAGWNEPGAPFSASNNAPSPSPQHAIFRLGCGTSDSQSNRGDWAVGLPQPRNSSLASGSGLGAGAMAQPYFAEPGQVVKLVCEPFDCASLASAAGAIVAADLTAVGGAASVALVDDGTLGDEFAGDGLYSLDVVIAAGTPAGTVHVPIALSSGPLAGAAFAGLNVLPSTTPNNDNCANAVAIAGPYSPAVQVGGNLTGATVEYDVVLSSSNSNPGSMSSRRGLWYSVTGSGNTLTADTCASPLIGGSTIPDTVMMVFAGSCDGLAVIAANDDWPTSCGAGSGTERRSRVSWCTLAGATYFIWIGPFATTPAPTFSYTLTLSDDGVSCSSAYAAASCPPSFAGLPESEPGFGPATNDGCDSSPGLFVAASPSFPAQVFHGTARSFGGARDHDWYRFQAAASDPFTAMLTAQFSGVLELRGLSSSGACSSNSLIASSPVGSPCQPASVSTTLVAGSWYAVRVVPTGNLPPGAPVFASGGIAPGADTFHYELELLLSGPPVNDLCANAAPLAFGVATAGATNALTGGELSTACDPSGRDVWYSVVLPAAGTLSLDTCGSAIDTALAVLDGCGGQVLACNDDCAGSPCGAPASCVTVSGLAAGSYRVRVSDKGVAGSFVVRASFEAANDTCANAAALAIPSSISGSTSGAAPDSGLPACGGPLGSQDFSATAPAVWYALSLPGAAGIDDKAVSIDTLGSSYDTKLSVFTGACGSLAAVTANDDIGASLHSKVAFRAVAGTPYFVLVHGFGSASGSFDLHASAAPIVANDDCASATSLAAGGGSTAGTLIGATGEPNSYSSTAMASCAGEFTAFDAWYAFTAACDTTLSLATCGATDTVVSVHASCPDAQDPHAIAGACNDEGSGACAPGSELALAVTSGATYFVRVAARDGASSGGAFTLSWSSTDTDGDGVSDCLDGCPFDPLKLAPGACGCGIPDTDSDGDGTADCLDGCPNDPLKIAPGVCGCGVSELDSDGDGTPDCVDGCPNDPLKTAPGACGCGIADTDSDGDGTPDCLDGCPNDPLKIAPGVCGCGVSELDSDGDGTPDCADGCPYDPLKTAPGACGCGVADTDSDGDGTPDCNDGCPNDPLKTAPGICGCGAVEEDLDSDGVVDCIDNCDSIANPGQEDCDGDGVGDACELAAGSFDTNGNGLPDECELGAAFSYCTAGTSTHGCAAQLASTGAPSASATSGFVIVGTGLEGQKPALFFYGISGPAAVPWVAGSTSFKCLAPPSQRCAILNSGGAANACNGTASLDFLAFVAGHPGALGAPLYPGEVVSAQLWYRDPPAPKTTNLSDALQFTLAP